MAHARCHHWLISQKKVIKDVLLLLCSNVFCLRRNMNQGTESVKVKCWVCLWMCRPHKANVKDVRDSQPSLGFGLTPAVTSQRTSDVSFDAVLCCLCDSSV